MPGVGIIAFVSDMGTTILLASGRGRRFRRNTPWPLTATACFSGDLFMMDFVLLAAIASMVTVDEGSPLCP